jgi:cysteine-S-conjugate beta-lyase
MSDKPQQHDTLLTHAGNKPFENFGVVNPPVYHASTILHRTMAAHEESQKRRLEKGNMSYGRYGTPTTFALEDAVAAVEAGDRVIAYCSGAAACYGSILGFVKSGDHLLMVDTVYGPVRAFCNGFLKRFGVETTFYDPMIGRDIAGLIRDNTKLIYLESPGSITFEVQDVPAIVAVAKSRGIVTVADNTWGSPMFFQPLKHGVNVSTIAGTKYIVGHSDVMLGAVITTEEMYLPVRTMAADLGHCAGPDDAYYALRGLRTLSVRLERHQKNALEVARWLQTRPEVSRVLYPALPEDPGHALWKRDFLGASGLFGVVLRPSSKEAVYALIDALDLFGIGASWGGFESLIQPTTPSRIRSATPWEAEGPSLRLHIGLEDPQDLIDDLDRGFHALRAAAAA